MAASGGGPAASSARPTAASGGGPAASTARPSRARLQITSRGAVVTIFLLSLAGDLAAGWLHVAVLTGLALAAGCLLVACYARRASLLVVAVAPPVVFFVAIALAEILTTHAATTKITVESIASGTLFTLASMAPWLFGCELAVLVIALVRGLPQCVRELRTGLRQAPPTLLRR
jgi:hypothetical protein